VIRRASVDDAQRIVRPHNAGRRGRRRAWEVWNGDGVRIASGDAVAVADAMRAAARAVMRARPWRDAMAPDAGRVQRLDERRLRRWTPNRTPGRLNEWTDGPAWTLVAEADASAAAPAAPSSGTSERGAALAAAPLRMRGGRGEASVKYQRNIIELSLTYH